MLAERPYQSSDRPINSVYNSFPGNNYSGTFSGYYSNMERANDSYMTHNSRSDSENRQSKSTALPTCVVSPSSSNSNGYFDEDSYPPGYIPSRKQREFIPENKKDDGYWEKRRKNNEAARRSREKRRVHDMALENRIMDLTRETCKYKNELILIKKKFGLPLDEPFTGDESDQALPDGRSLENNPPRPMLSPDNQNRYQQSLQQSPVRSRNVSGTSPSSYMPGFTSHNPSLRHPSSQVIAESFYLNRPHPDSDFLPHSGKYDAHSAYMKSTKERPCSPVMRVDDQVRPAYSAALPPNQISPYSSPLPVPYQKSYWLPTTDLTSSDSNDEYDSYDQVQEQPLSLVKKRPSTENESSGELSNGSSCTSNSPPSSSASLPFKLRHKGYDLPTSVPTPASNGPFYSSGLAQLSEVALAHPHMPAQSSEDFGVQSSLDSFKARPRSFSNPRSAYDVKYVERRRKNNEAARKCRENRKQITKIREVKSGYLESENGKLKDELVGLQEEMRELRDLLEKKRGGRDNRDDTEDRKEEVNKGSSASGSVKDNIQYDSENVNPLNLNIKQETEDMENN